jgi:predicted phosphodiesterase
VELGKMKTKILFYVASDIHLSDKPPICRSGEKNWIEVQMEYLNQLLKQAGNKAIIIAGDFFDTWKVSPELEKRALQIVKQGNFIIIPGQHDLLNHRIENLEKGSLGVIGEVCRVIDKPSTSMIEIDGQQLGVDFYPWESSLLETTGSQISISHSMVWKSKVWYGSSKDTYIKSIRKKYHNYHISIFGDNHAGFYSKKSSPAILNCGAFSIRRTDQEFYRPKFYSVDEYLQVKEYFLDISKDVFTKEFSESTKEQPIAQYVRGINISKFNIDLDYRQNLLNEFEMNKVNPKVQKIIIEALGEKK